MAARRAAVPSSDWRPGDREVRCRSCRSRRSSTAPSPSATACGVQRRQRPHLEAVIAAAEEVRSPLIVQTSVKTVKSMGAEVLYGLFRALAEPARSP